jgi:hypothetical protein
MPNSKAKILGLVVALMSGKYCALPYWCHPKNYRALMRDTSRQLNQVPDQSSNALIAQNLPRQLNRVPTQFSMRSSRKIYPDSSNRCQINFHSALMRDAPCQPEPKNGVLLR